MIRCASACFLSAQAGPGESPSERLRVITYQAQLAESLGFETIFLGHHYLASSQFFQPLSTAAYLAAVTDRIRIGLGIYLLRSLDNASFGR
ncbi:MAG: LLM class flavin-dependent oxidoreductase [Actinomycetia bacterium]|nr:LLM class flavin-dependent oxidoreductase [Actinomycetes bacterium]